MRPRGTPLIPATLVRLCAGGRRGAEVLRELEQEYLGDICRRLHPYQARRWYWKESLSLVVWYLRSRASDLVPSRSQPTGGRPSSRRTELESMWQDIRYALRRLQRQPLFTMVAVATLTLGIGANTAIFSVVNAVVLRPLPYPDAERLVKLCEVHPEVAGLCNVSPPNVEDWSTMSSSVESMGLARAWPFMLRDERGSEGLYAGVATPGLFDVFGVATLHGRLIEPRDMEIGDNRVVLLSHEFWVGRFGADESLVGETITLDEEPFRVVGVLGPEAVLPGLERVQLWAPMTVGANIDDRSWRGFSAFGKIRPGVDLAAVRSDLEVIQANLASEYPATNDGWGIEVRRLHDEVIGEARSTLLVFQGAVVFVLLIACTNVANLLLAKTTGRRGELALRAALGAGRSRLVRLLLAESSLLSVVGGGLGAVFAVWATRLFLAAAPSGLPRLNEVSTDPRVLGFTAGMTFLSAVVFGLVLSLRFARIDVGAAMTAASSQRVTSGSRLRNGLVVAEVALALALLVGAGLLLRSFAGHLAWNPGFDRDRLLTVWTLSSLGKYSEPEEILRAHEQAAREVEALASVAAVSFASGGPLFGGRETLRFAIDGVSTPAPGQEPVVRWFAVGSSYLSILGRAIVGGRGLNDGDGLEAPLVAVINQTAASRYFVGVDPIGRIIEWLPGGPSFEIVGIVEDGIPFRPGTSPEPELYWPYAQAPRGATWLLVQTEIGAAAASRDVRERLRANDPDMQITPMRTFGELESRQLTRPRFNMMLVGSFAIAALLLAALGIYGVMAYMVVQQTQEIGVRLALGATPGQVRRGVLGRGATLALWGLLIGSGLALAAGRLIVSLLHGVQPTDPLTFLVAVGFFALTALAACYLPARRASMLDPVTALRG